MSLILIMPKPFKFSFLIAACTAVTLVVSLPAVAQNWLILQETEPSGADAGLKLWGFIQPEFQYTNGTSLIAGA